jgi:hypothetical protein
MTPTDVTSGSNKKYWWLCDVGLDHEWVASPNNRAAQGSGCPCCSGHKVLVTNSLASLVPKIAAQWHPTKNCNITPANITSRSKTGFWWLCGMGVDHEWKTSPYSRVRYNTGCPCCSGKQVSVTNSLTTFAPEVAAQWHPTKNGDVSLASITIETSRKCWWLCDLGSDHEWQASPADRVGKGSGCPCSTGRQLSVSNSFAVVAPKVASQWHQLWNGEVTAADITSKTAMKYWWLCDAGSDHVWKASPSNRVGQGTGCPFCRGRQFSATKSLAMIAPRVAAQWHSSLNGDVTPADVGAKVSTKYWWLCDIGGPDHIWDASPYSRVRLGSGCPCCSGRKVSVTNSLAALAPEVAAQWHPTRNGETTPADVAPYSNKDYWWLCDVGPDHEWIKSCVSRVAQGSGCPFCSSQRISVTNSLAMVKPTAATV